MNIISNIFKGLIIVDKYLGNFIKIDFVLNYKIKMFSINY